MSRLFRRIVTLFRGGGIGGVTPAIALSKYPDVHFDLYEAAGAFEEIGAGVGIFARSVYALTDLGLIEQLEKIRTLSTSSGMNYSSCIHYSSSS